jgi:hypothetical protein
MSSLSHEPTAVLQERRPWSRVLVPEMWAALAIVVIWLVVLFVGVWGPDLVSNNGVAGVGESSTVPSVIVVAPFAFLGTWVVARYGFGFTRPRTE